MNQTREFLVDAVMDASPSLSVVGSFVYRYELARLVIVGLRDVRVFQTRLDDARGRRAVTGSTTGTPVELELMIPRLVGATSSGPLGCGGWTDALVEVRLPGSGGRGRGRSAGSHAGPTRQAAVSPVRAVVFDRYGPPSVLRIAEVDVPEPA